MATRLSFSLMILTVLMARIWGVNGGNMGAIPAGRLFPIPVIARPDRGINLPWRTFPGAFGRLPMPLLNPKSFCLQPELAIGILVLPLGTNPLVHIMVIN